MTPGATPGATPTETPGSTPGATPTSGGPVTPGSTPGATPSFLQNLQAGLAGLGNNVSTMPKDDTGLLTEDLSDADLEALKKGVVKRAWFERGKTIQKVAFDAASAVRGDRVAVTIKTKDYDPDTPVKFTLYAFHAPSVVAENRAPYRLELATLDAKLDADGVAIVDYELQHDIDAKIKVAAKIGDHAKTSPPLKYTVEEGLGEDEEAMEFEAKSDEEKDVDAIVGDEIKLMAECENMPDKAQLKFSLYPEGKEVADAFTTVAAVAEDNQIVARWTVEYWEDATIVFEGGTDFSKAKSENKLKVATEATDDLSTDEEEVEGGAVAKDAKPAGGEPAGAEPASAKPDAKPAETASKAAPPGPAVNTDVDDLAPAQEGDGGAKTAAAPPAPGDTPPPA